MKQNLTSRFQAYIFHAYGKISYLVCQFQIFIVFSIRINITDCAKHLRDSSEWWSTLPRIYSLQFHHKKWQNTTIFIIVVIMLWSNDILWFSCNYCFVMEIKVLLQQYDNHYYYKKQLLYLHSDHQYFNNYLSTCRYQTNNELSGKLKEKNSLPCNERERHYQSFR